MSTCQEAAVDLELLGVMGWISKILSPALALVCIRIFLFFLVRRQLVVGSAYACRTKDQSVQSTKCAPGSIVACFAQ